MKTSNSWVVLTLVVCSFGWAKTVDFPVRHQPVPTGAADAATNSEAVPVVLDSAKLALIEGHRATYPKEAEKEQIQGRVWLRIHVSESGTVEGAEVISGNPILADAAKKAALKFKFKPFIRNGTAVKVSTRYPFDFFFRKQLREAPEGYLQTASGSLQKLQIQGGEITTGLLIRRIEPIYPREAKRKGIQGTVVLKAVIGKNGTIQELTPLSGPDELIPAAVGAVEQWLYRPYLKNGKPVEVDTQITVNFALSR